MVGAVMRVAERGRDASPWAKSQNREPERPLSPQVLQQSILKAVSPWPSTPKLVPNKMPVTDMTTEAVSVDITAPPTQGEANAELYRCLSKVLELGKSPVVLDKGGKSREKVVKLLASTPPEEILEKLKKQVENK